MPLSSWFCGRLISRRVRAGDAVRPLAGVKISHSMQLQPDRAHGRLFRQSTSKDPRWHRCACRVGGIRSIRASKPVGPCRVNHGHGLVDGLLAKAWMPCPLALVQSVARRTVRRRIPTSVVNRSRTAQALESGSRRVHCRTCQMGLGGRLQGKKPPRMALAEHLEQLGPGFTASRARAPLLRVDQQLDRQSWDCFGSQGNDRASRPSAAMSSWPKPQRGDKADGEAFPTSRELPSADQPSRLRQSAHRGSCAKSP